MVYDHIPRELKTALGELTKGITWQTAWLGVPISGVPHEGAGSSWTLRPLSQLKRKQVNIKLAVQAVAKAGLEIGGIQIEPDGKVTIFTRPVPDQQLPLDTWLKKRASAS